MGAAGRVMLSAVRAQSFRATGPMHSVVTAIIVRDLLCNVAHSPDLSIDVEPTPYAQTQDDELLCVSWCPAASNHFTLDTC
jgi:hypothetical protein